MIDITPKLLREWNACCSDDEIAEVFAGRESMTPREFAALDIPAERRLWALLRKDVIPAARLASPSSLMTISSSR